jgi:membrane protein DedA with SNARE-associated domain
MVGILNSRKLRLFGVSDKRLNMVKHYYSEHGKFTLFFAKMSDVLAMPAILLAGFIKMDFKVFMVVSVSTSILKGSLLFGAGFLLSYGYHEIPALQLLYAMAGLSVLALAIVVFRYNYLKIRKG